MRKFDGERLFPHCDFKALASCSCCNDSVFSFPVRSKLELTPILVTAVILSDVINFVWFGLCDFHPISPSALGSSCSSSSSRCGREHCTTNSRFCDFSRTIITDACQKNLGVIVIFFMHTLQSTNWKIRGEESDAATLVKNELNFHDPKVLYCLGCDFIPRV